MNRTPDPRRRTRPHPPKPGRLALRALYLASLAHLAEQGMLAIARHKSNRDYQNELARRAHAVPGVTDAFGQNVLLFERVWYGMHAITRELTDRFSVNQDAMVKLMGWAGNMTLSNAFLQGVLTA